MISPIMTSRWQIFERFPHFRGADLGLKYTCAIIHKFCKQFGPRSGPEVIKLFFMLNSAEHEIYPAHKCLNANNCWHFNIY